MNNARFSITIERTRVVTILVCVVSVLALLNGLGLYLTFGLGYQYAKGFVPLFNLDNESNVPTYFSAMMLFAASFLFYWASRYEISTGSKFSRHWTLLSFIFLLLSVDEAASIHEKFIGPLRESFDLSGPLYFSWVLVGFAVVIIFAIYYYRFVLNLPGSIRTGMVLAGVIYLSGVLGLELIDGNYVSLYGDGNLTYQLLTSCEELLEMTGVVILINVLLKHLHANRVRAEMIFDGKQ